MTQERTMPQKQFSVVRPTVCTLCEITIVGWIVLASALLAYGQSKPPSKVPVRVTITNAGLYLSHSTVKAGVVQLLIVNRTLIRNPQLRITDVRGANAGTPIGPGAARKNFQELTLTPGSYSLTLAVNPKANVKLEVRP